MMTYIPALTRLAFAVLVLSQTAPQPATSADAIVRAEAKWQATKPAVYEFTIELNCFCDIEIPAPSFRVTNGTPARVTPVDPKRAGNYSAFDTIDELLTNLKFYASRGAVKFNVQYETEFGYPVSADLDRSRDMSDDELAFKVNGF